MDYAIIVNDNGELKTVTAAEIEAHDRATDIRVNHSLNVVLDARSAEEREEIDKASAGVL